MKNLIIIFSLLFALASLEMFAFAQDENSGACKADVEKFCKDIKPGKGRILACLKSHSEELSPECKAKGEEVKGKVQDFMQACKDDMKTLCKGTPPGGGRLFACLRSNEAKLSPTCKEAMTKK